MAANVGALAMQSLCRAIETSERAATQRALVELPACTKATCLALIQRPNKGTA
jgi:hypothetical protein